MHGFARSRRPYLHLFLVEVDLGDDAGSLALVRLGILEIGILEDFVVVGTVCKLVHTLEFAIEGGRVPSPLALRLLHAGVVIEKDVRSAGDSVG